MTQIDRRSLLLASAASMALPSALARAWAIDARVAKGTIEDVEHIVILMQENRSFDHYFGTMPGVRGFGDRFPVPLAGGRTVWSQTYSKGGLKTITPFALNTTQTFEHMRAEGTPHSWPDAQYAWNHGRMTNWPDFKRPHAMGHFEEADIPFQWAMANAFTLCEAYHCSFHGGTNTNRLFMWTGGNDGDGKAGGPSITNSHDNLKDSLRAPYTWTTYPERLEAAGVSWKIYEDMADNFGDNPLVGFKTFQDSVAGVAGSNPALAAKGLSTQHLDVLRADVMAGTLPQISWVVSPEKDSEHPGPSSPAQGADYTARVLDCLTSNPDVWAKTILLVNFDENDGYFDHMPPPAPPSLDAAGKMLGASTIDTAGEYHWARAETEKHDERADLMGRPYGLGPRVPLYVISPWSRGGWINAEVFDHTSVIRFCEARFGVKEPNISPWRRAVCGDLTSCFDFKTPNKAIAEMPETAATAARAAALPKRTTPPIPAGAKAPVQATGVRPSRALPYALDAALVGIEPARIEFRNTGAAAVVFHVYDLKREAEPPKRYTVGAKQTLTGEWPAGDFDLFILGPNGFHRRYVIGAGLAVELTAKGEKATLGLKNLGRAAVEATVSTGPYAKTLKPWRAKLSPGESDAHIWSLSATRGWYEFVIATDGQARVLQRLAGRIETSKPSTSDPAMGGPAVMGWS